MTILVTAASGQLGPLVIDALLARGAEPADLVASARDTSKLADVAARGIRTVELDYGRPDTIAAALEGVDTVLLISGRSPARASPATATSSTPRRPPACQARLHERAQGHHRRLRARRRPQGHRGGDRRIGRSRGDRAPQLVHRELRGGCHARGLDRHHRGIRGRRPRGRATRADYADGDAVVLLEDGHLGQVYEFGGDVAWDYAELAAAASEVVGRPVEFESLTTAEHVAALESVGLDAGRPRSSRGSTTRSVAACSRTRRDAVAAHRPADDAARGWAARGRAGAGAVRGLSWGGRLRPSFR